MGRTPSGTVRKQLRLPQELWDIVFGLAKKNKRDRHRQVEAMIEDWLYFTTREYERTGKNLQAGKITASSILRNPPSLGPTQSTPPRSGKARSAGTRHEGTKGT